MFRDLKRRLFPNKYLLRENAKQLARIERRMVEYQALIDHFIAASAIKSDDIKDLAYFFHLKRKESKSQIGQDLWALWETHGKTGGYFVEFGAADGQNLSNTWLLEQKYGWTGILAEPMPDWHEKLKARKAIVEHRCVWSKSGEKLTFYCSIVPELSGLKATADQDGHTGNRKNARQIEVETISLLDLLQAHKAPKVIDYMSVDTEGSEFDILANFDFARYDVNLISVEHNHSELREKIRGLLLKNGFARAFEEFSGCDDWYVHERVRKVARG
jgi:FkbM family methyltransferase